MGLRKNIKETPREKRKRRKINPTILIVCEGKETEPLYFKGFRSRYVNVNIEIPEKSSMGKNRSKTTDPLNLIKKSIYYKQNKYYINAEDGDRVWCVFDIDVNYQNPDSLKAKSSEIQAAYEVAKRNNIKLGISNPCFELWYLLHFTYTTAFLKDFDAVRQKLENTPLKGYKKTSSIPSDIKMNTSVAISNSLKLKDYHESLGKKLINFEDDPSNVIIKDFVESNPYTNIADLVMYMEELEKLKD